MKKENPALSMSESHWKLRQQYHQNFPIEEKQLKNQYKGQKTKINPKE